MNKPKTGRPTKVTDEVVGKLEDAFKHGANVTEACYYSGISRDTFYAHFVSDQEFSDRMERARSWLYTIAKRNISSLIMMGDYKTSMWLIEKHCTMPEGSIGGETSQ